MKNSSRPGTGTSPVSDLRAADPLDRLIFEEGLRVAKVDVLPDGSAVVLTLNNGVVFAARKESIASLSDATVKELKACVVFANGTGIAWPKLDVHLSLKGFLNSMVRDEVIRRLRGQLISTGGTKAKKKPARAKVRV